MHVLYQLTYISTDPPPSSVTALAKVRSCLLYFDVVYKMHLYIYTSLHIYFSSSGLEKQQILIYFQNSWEFQKKCNNNGQF